VYDKSAVQNLEQLIMDMKESLEREIGSLRSEMREGFARINSRFDLQAARLDRHAGLWQTGRRWSSKMDVWAEGVDTALETKDREISELRARLDRLERDRPNSKP
jgi:DNA-binding GntR family transcriptional regulator